MIRDMVMNIDESQDIRWINPREALEENKADEKKFPIVVPTYVTLDDLSRHDSVDSVFEDMKNQGPRTYHSWLLQDKENKQKYLCWEGDSLYGKDFADEFDVNYLCQFTSNKEQNGGNTKRYQSMLKQIDKSSSSKVNYQIAKISSNRPLFRSAALALGKPSKLSYSGRDSCATSNSLLYLLPLAC
eukprot:Awhi_evm2s11876